MMYGSISASNADKHEKQTVKVLNNNTTYSLLRPLNFVFDVVMG